MSGTSHEAQLGHHTLRRQIHCSWDPSYGNDIRLQTRTRAQNQRKAALAGAVYPPASIVEAFETSNRPNL